MITIDKSTITERIIELNWELLESIRNDNNERVKLIRLEINNLINLYLKNEPYKNGVNYSD